MKAVVVVMQPGLSAGSMAMMSHNPVNGQCPAWAPARGSGF